MFICDKFEEIWGKSLGKQVHESIIIIILLIKASSMGKYRINALFFLSTILFAKQISASDNISFH